MDRGQDGFVPAGSSRPNVEIIKTAQRTRGGEIQAPESARPGALFFDNSLDARCDVDANQRGFGYPSGEMAIGVRQWTSSLLRHAKEGRAKVL